MDPLILSVTETIKQVNTIFIPRLSLPVSILYSISRQTLFYIHSKYFGRAVLSGCSKTLSGLRATTENDTSQHCRNIWSECKREFDAVSTGRSRI